MISGRSWQLSLGLNRGAEGIKLAACGTHDCRRDDARDGCAMNFEQAGDFGSVAPGAFLPSRRQVCHASSPGAAPACLTRMTSTVGCELPKGPNMADENRLRRLAILIDADNTSPRVADGLFEEIAKFGEASVRRIYGDFSSPRLKSWIEILQKHAIDPYQQFAYTSGKNASDIALVIDAMDLLHTGRFDGFCLVSSDSDFTRLASRLREQGADVYGFGMQKTPESFRQACRRFIYTENLLPDAEVATLEEGRSRKALEPPRAAIPILNKAIAQLETEDGWVGLGRGRSTLSEHRLRLRHAYLRLSETQRSGPQDRSVRHGAAEGRGHADQGKDNSAIKNRFEAGMTASQVCDASACGAALSSSISVGSIR